MIKGIGNDIIEIERIKKAISKPNFLNKYFTLNEVDMFKKRNNRVETIAGNFTVKEAVSKVLGTGFNGFGLKDIEVLRNKKGQPYVILYNNADVMAKSLGIDKILVSISHCKLYAYAIAIGESVDKNVCC